MSEENFTVEAEVNRSSINIAYDKCFKTLYKQDENQDASWTNLLKTCIQKHIDILKLVKTANPNELVVRIPKFIEDAEEEEDEDEEDEDDD